MNKQTYFRLLRTGFLVGLTLFSALAVQAQEKAVSEETFKVLKEADEALRKGQSEQALRQLRTIQSQVAGKPYDHAVVQQYLAYAYSGANDFRGARQAANAALNSKLLDADAEHGLRNIAGQAAFHLEAYRESVTHLDQWLQREPRADADIYYMVAYAAYRANMSRSATRHLERAVALKKSPPAEWIQLLLSLYVESKDYSKAEPLVKRLIADSPNKREWWRYLSGLYAQQNRHDRAISTMMLAYFIGEVRQEDVLNLVKFHAQQGYPSKAARLLETEIENKRVSRNYENLKLLFGCWQLAREHNRARQVLTEAAAISPNGEDYLLSGRIAMQRGDWTIAKQEFQKSLRKGGLKRKAHARLWLGIAALKSQDETLARHSLEAVLNVADVKQEAAYWLKRIERGKKRHEHHKHHRHGEGLGES
ncbi:tetratricopeptide repeat protein [Methylotuvimicrobium buryatense]|uniref:Tetratricopeptide repeat protein n=1 Tax=Methylotuvimicrobium buryatense TaxID=95641 RepID=A0A4P9UV14_METBY|nr:tetratricopeptide repeat protein [Methylotuvimicrobium buryatense]QCW83536.1 tetratricopeptide repeat protein [Methylotuvimicrobium buryatense]